MDDRALETSGNGTGVLGSGGADTQCLKMRGQTRRDMTICGGQQDIPTCTEVVAAFEDDEAGCGGGMV